MHFTHVVCLECGDKLPADLMLAGCPKCQSAWIDARYDYAAVAKKWPAALQERAHTLWRYAELLPISEPNPEISMGEGYTSLIRLYQYERMLNHENIYIKDERQGPTSSFKDRQAALAVTAMQRAGITECVLASTGNAAAAYAAYCARAGIKLWLFLTSLVPAEKMREATLYGAEVVKVSGTYDETKEVAAAFAHRRGIHLDKGAKAIPGKESMKTLGFEIAEQLGLALHPNQPGKFASPDWYIQAVSGGIGPLGVWKGFSELHQMGLINKMPRLGIVQAAGCAPMVKALAAGQAKADSVVPQTLITVLATGDPGHSYVLLREAVLSNKGAMIAVEDGDTFEAMRKLASRAGISVEPATAVAFAGLEKMIGDGTIATGETVVVNCSGHTFPVESHVLGDQYILNLDPNSANHQEEGLSAALQNLDEQVTTVMVVDDNLNDRRLIRRLLQRYRSYRVYEAPNGQEALKILSERQPDLIISDLTMPVMDGFSLLEQLKANPDTKDIPVIVVSAKTLTQQDRELLNSHSESIWTKGGYNTRQLVDHVVKILGHTSTEVSSTSRPVMIASPASTVTDVEPCDPDAPKIVIIEDNRNDLRLARRYLQASGSFQIIGAGTGREGLKAVYEQHPELVILDLMLPDMDGIAVLEALKSNPDLNDIPVVIMSARELSKDETENLKSKIHTILRKSLLDRNAFDVIIGDVLK